MSDDWKTRQCPKCGGCVDYSGQHDCVPNIGELLLDSLGDVSMTLDKGYWRDDAQYRLARFYAVYTKDALIEAQAKHIEKLQAARQLLRDTPPELAA